MVKIVKGYQKYVSAKYEAEDNLPNADLQIIQMQKAAQECLANYAKKDETAEFPKELASHLSFAFLELLSGETPLLFQPPQKGAGRKGDGYNVAEYKKDAVKYILYCKNKLIDDSRHIQTVREIYKISKRAVQEWVVKYKKEIIIPHTITKKERLRVTKIMEKSGEFYTKSPNAATQAAILNRDTRGGVAE